MILLHLTAGVHLHLIGGFWSTLTGGLSDIAGFAESALKFIENPFLWLWDNTFGNLLKNNALDFGCTTKSGAICQNLYTVLAAKLSVAGVVIAGSAGIARVLRSVWDERTTGMHIIIDSGIRTAVVITAMTAPSPENSVVAQIENLLIQASNAMASGIWGAAMGAVRTLNQGKLFNLTDFGVGVPASAFLAQLAKLLIKDLAWGNGALFFFLIPLIVAAVFFLYWGFLWILRYVQLAFAVALAPLFVGVAVFDHKNRFTTWWVELFLSALVLPFCLNFGMAISIATAIFFFDKSMVGFFLGIFAYMGGIWMTGKMVHGLAWKQFSHGGLSGALSAASTTVMAVPFALNDANIIKAALTDKPLFKPGGRLDKLSMSRLAQVGGVEAMLRGSRMGGPHAPAPPSAGDSGAGPDGGGPSGGGPETGPSPQPAPSGTGPDGSSGPGGAGPVGDPLFDPSTLSSPAGGGMNGSASAHRRAMDAATSAGFAYRSTNQNVRNLFAGGAGGAASDFDRDIGAAIGNFAGTDAGRQSIEKATAHLGYGDYGSQVGAYVGMVARSPELLEPVVQSMSSAHMNNSLPDLSGVLDGKMPSAAQRMGSAA